MRRLVWCFLLASFVPAGFLDCATSTVWETSGFSDLLKGRLSGLSLTPNGVLVPGPAQRWSVALGQPALWSMAQGPDGSIYAATGHSGKVFRIDANGRQSQIWASEQAEVFALAVDSRGRVYAGTSPNGGIYRLEAGKAQEIWRSPAKYIWNLSLTADGTLFAGTGEAGRIYKLDEDGKGGVYYETEQANITALAVGQHGQLYAGTEPNGIVYEIAGQGKGTVLYDSTLPEIRAIVPAPDGSVYVAAMGGALSTRTGNTPSSTSNVTGVVTASSPTVITVNEAHNAENVQSAARTSVTSSVVTGPTTTNTAASGSVTEVAGLEKSAVYRIAVDHTVETLRSSKEDNVYDLALAGDSVLFSTDDHGRVYRLEGTKAMLLLEPGDGETTRLLQNGPRLYFALSNPARVLSFDTEARSVAQYQSQVHDSGSVAKWGHLQWRGSGAGIRFETRTGNAVRPDATWSSWSAPISDAQHALMGSPIARYVQWRAEWSAGNSAECSSVTVPYLPQNNTPVIRSVTVTSILGTNPAKAAAGASATSSAYSVTVTDTGETPAASTASSSGQTVSRLQTTQTQVSWQADDPDSDKLVYALYFRPEEAHEWQLIRSRMGENTLLLDPDVFADGRYMFRVVATDAPSNAAQYVKQTELVSSAVLIDNTPPVIAMGKPRRQGSAIELDFTATDAASSLKKCEYSIDGGYWQPIEAVDGITDTPSEHFHLQLDRIRPGEHLIVVRVYDSASNAGLARVLIP